MRLGRTRWHRVPLIWLDRLAKASSIFLGAINKATPDKFPDLAQPAIKSLQLGWWVPAILIIAPTIAAIRRRTDNSKLDPVHNLLNQICEATFKNETFELEQHARVTLFRYRAFTIREWPFFGGWLIPIERSGSSTRTTQALFRAHDDGEQCNGVAGRAWARRKAVSVDELPDLRHNATDENLQTYAQRSFMTVKRLKKKIPQAQSLFGIPIEVDGKGWGVIVIDSAHPKIKVTAAKRIFNDLSPTLTGYLKGL